MIKNKKLAISGIAIIILGIVGPLSQWVWQLTLLFLAVGALLLWMSRKPEKPKSSKIAGHQRPVKKPLINQFHITTTAPDDYVVIDLETTGLNPVDNDIVQIAALKFINHTERDRFSTYLSPVVPISREAASVNHINSRMLKGKPYLEDISDQLMDFIDGFTLVAHNAKFDIPFLQTRLGFRIENSVIDTIFLARYCIKGVENYKLETLKKYLGLTYPSHDALNDCLTTARLYEYCLPFFPETDTNTELKPDPAPPLAGPAKSFFDSVTSILMSENRDVSRMSALDGTNNVIIHFLPYIPIYQFKYNGRLRYWKVNVPLSEIAVQYGKYFKVGPATKAEGGDDASRIFIDDPGRLSELKELVLSEYDRASSYQKARP